MAWWVWVLLGFGLLLCEVLTAGGFFFLFFGMGAIVVGALVWLDVGGGPPMQWLLFTAVSLAGLIPLRGRLVRWVSSDETAHRVDSLVGEEAVLLDDLTPGGVAKGELHGSTWTVRAARACRKGERARVARVDGLTLWLE
jgi:membrane protein implicated in regulation of membrane protease activity